MAIASIILPIEQLRLCCCPSTPIERRAGHSRGRPTRGPQDASSRRTARALPPRSSAASQRANRPRGNPRPIFRVLFKPRRRSYLGQGTVPRRRHRRLGKHGRGSVPSTAFHLSSASAGPIWPTSPTATIANLLMSIMFGMAQELPDGELSKDAPGLPARVLHRPHDGRPAPLRRGAASHGSNRVRVKARASIGGNGAPRSAYLPPPYPSSSCRTTYAANPRKARTMASARRLVRWWQQQLQLTLGRYMGRSASAWVER